MSIRPLARSRYLCDTGHEKHVLFVRLCYDFLDEVECLCYKVHGDAMPTRKMAQELGKEDILKFVFSKVTNGGLHKREFVEYHNATVAPGWTVEQLVNTSIEIGIFSWENDLLKSVNSVK